MEKLRNLELSLAEGYKKGAKVIRDGIVDNEEWKIEYAKILKEKEFEMGLMHKDKEESREAWRAMRRALYDDSDEAKAAVLEELGDRLTVIEAYLELKNWAVAELLQAKQEKDERMGKFTQRKMAKSVRRRR